MISKKKKKWQIRKQHVLVSLNLLCQTCVSSKCQICQKFNKCSGLHEINSFQSNVKLCSISYLKLNSHNIMQNYRNAELKKKYLSFIRR